MKTKNELRKEIKERLNQQNKAQRLQKSLLIKKKLFRLAEFKRAKLVMFYLATQTEVETRAMIVAAQKLGKQIALPKITRREEHKRRSQKMIASLVKDLEQELTPGPYGIMQPKDGYTREVRGEKIDLVAVPGLAFDREGRRLGRGKGYYDRFLASLPEYIPRIGLSFDFQILDRLPALSHDIAVTKVISA